MTKVYAISIAIWLALSVPLALLIGRALRNAQRPAPAARHPFFERCEHGVQFLNECDDCPNGGPVLSDDVYGPQPGARCLLCGPDDQDLRGEDLMDHLRLFHPDQWGDGPDVWPDGKPVVVDTTLEPGDFTGERRWGT